MNTRFTAFSFRSAFVKISALLVMAGFICLGCDKPQDQRAPGKKTYYNLKEFIETQITFLSEQKPTVDKTMRVSGKQEARSTKEVDWKKELELFVQADINKPSYSKSYTVDKPDSLTSVYTLATTEPLTVRYLKVQLDKTTGNPVFIQALLKSENKLYESEKNIELHCGSQSNQWRLTSYAISGYQKLATMDKKDFDIKAQVKYW